MSFDWKNYIRIIYLGLVRLDRWTIPVTLTNYMGRFMFVVIGTLFELFNASCFLLDNIFFPDWRCQKIRRPIFIIGPPRSGTTLLHRLMALDKDKFFFFRTWEIIFPSVVQKKALRLINALSLGGIKALLLKAERGLFGELNKMHPVSLFAAEEDDYLFLHIFSGHDLVWLFPFAEMEAYLRMDECLGLRDRVRVIGFLKRSIQRQAFFLGHQGIYLSKAPAHSARVASLLETFPDARFIYMVRNPLEVIPSMINLAHHLWKKTSKVQEGFPFLEPIYDILKYFYKYPIEFFDKHIEHKVTFVRYSDLISSPVSTIESIYRNLGLNISDAFRQNLAQEEEKMKFYSSQHKYSLSDMLIDPQRIVEDLHDIFVRFDIPTT